MMQTKQLEYNDKKSSSFSLTQAIYSIFTPLSNSDAGAHSMRAKISTSGVKLDISSLATNDRVTKQISDALKASK